ncbi:MAG: hypothetical protein A2046_15175 [Bacteroidetes bacterium GWA2_30_7]|nr:MAG: hypothetical protein A2046_15175 [Bacteroidetes bacterium GWA2_30_7]
MIKYYFFIITTYLMGFVLCNNNVSRYEFVSLDCDSLKLIVLDSLADEIIKNSNLKSVEKTEIVFFNIFPDSFKEFKCLYGYEGEFNGLVENLGDGIGAQYAEKHIIQVFSNLKINSNTVLNKLLKISIEAHWQPDAVNYLIHFLKEKLKSTSGGYEIMFSFLAKHEKSEIKNFWEFYYAYEEPVIADTLVLKYKLKYAEIVKIHDLVVLENKDIKH